MAVAWDGAPLMRFLKRNTEAAEDPAVVARREAIAARTRGEPSFYQAVRQPQQSQALQRLAPAGEEAA